MCMLEASEGNNGDQISPSLGEIVHCCCYIEKTGEVHRTHNQYLDLYNYSTVGSNCQDGQSQG